MLLGASTPTYKQASRADQKDRASKDHQYERPETARDILSERQREVHDAAEHQQNDCRDEAEAPGNHP